jgi:hypothetical protein
VLPREVFWTFLSWFGKLSRLLFRYHNKLQKSISMYIKFYLLKTPVSVCVCVHVCVHVCVCVCACVSKRCRMSSLGKFKS